MFLELLIGAVVSGTILGVNKVCTPPKEDWCINKCRFISGEPPLKYLKNYEIYDKLYRQKYGDYDESKVH